MGGGGGGTRQFTDKTVHRQDNSLTQFLKSIDSSQTEWKRVKSAQLFHPLANSPRSTRPIPICMGDVTYLQRVDKLLGIKWYIDRAPDKRE